MFRHFTLHRKIFYWKLFSGEMPMPTQKSYQCENCKLGYSFIIAGGIYPKVVQYDCSNCDDDKLIKGE